MNLFLKIYGFFVLSFLISVFLSLNNSIIIFLFFVNFIILFVEFSISLAIAKKTPPVKQKAERYI